MKWEYQLVKLTPSGLFGGKIDVDQLNEVFNALGRDEWEFVSCFGANQSYGATRDVIATFKRPRN